MLTRAALNRQAQTTLRAAALTNTRQPRRYRLIALTASNVDARTCAQQRCSADWAGRRGALAALISSVLPVTERSPEGT
jgi:hypothetical protein